MWFFPTAISQFYPHLPVLSVFSSALSPPCVVPASFSFSHYYQAYDTDTTCICPTCIDAVLEISQLPRSQEAPLLMLVSLEWSSRYHHLSSLDSENCSKKLVSLWFLPPRKNNRGANCKPNTDATTLKEWDSGVLATAAGLFYHWTNSLGISESNKEE